MNNYTIICDNIVFRDSFIEKIVKTNKLSKENIINLYEKDFGDAVFELDSYNLFNTIKLVILEKPNLKSNTTTLLKYLDNPSDNILVIVLDEKPKLASVLKLIDKTKLVEDNLNLDEYIKEYLTPKKVDYAVIKFLRSYLSDNKDLIKNTLDKFMFLDEDELTVETIKKLSDSYSEVNVFEIINSFLAMNGELAYKKYIELSRNEDIYLMFSSLLRDTLIIMRDAFLLKKYNYDYNDIISKLKVNRYRFQNTMKYAYNFDIEKLNKLINELNDLEVNFKTGKSVTGLFEYFLFNIGGIYES